MRINAAPNTHSETERWREREREREGREREIRVHCTRLERTHCHCVRYIPVGQIFGMAKKGYYTNEEGTRQRFHQRGTDDTYNDRDNTDTFVAGRANRMQHLSNQFGVCSGGIGHRIGFECGLEGVYSIPMAQTKTTGEIEAKEKKKSITATQKNCTLVSGDWISLMAVHPANA